MADRGGPVMRETAVGCALSVAARKEPIGAACAAELSPPPLVVVLFHTRRATSALHSPPNATIS